jgi:hypothetical protein
MQSTSIRFSVRILPNQSRPEVAIVAGIGNQGGRQPYTGNLSTEAIQEELRSIRDMSSGHWAYLKIGGRRVDDDRIERALKAVR